MQAQQELLQRRLPMLDQKQGNAARLQDDVELSGAVDGQHAPPEASSWRLAHLSSPDMDVGRRHDAGCAAAAHWDIEPGEAVLDA